MTTAAAAPAYIRQPLPQPDSAAVEHWLTEIPPHILPRRTAEQFRHVVNEIVRLWKSPRQLDRYFDSLLIDHRGGRRGFPMTVALELANLRQYYQEEVYPLNFCIWTGAA